MWGGGVRREEGVQVGVNLGHLNLRHVGAMSCGN